MAFLHTVTDVNGKVHKRRSMNHRYPFAIVAHYPARTSKLAKIPEWPAYSSASWSSRRIYAEQYAADRMRNGAESVEILETTIEERRSKHDQTAL